MLQIIRNFRLGILVGQTVSLNKVDQCAWRKKEYLHSLGMDGKEVLVHASHS